MAHSPTLILTKSNGLIIHGEVQLKLTDVSSPEQNEVVSTVNMVCNYIENSKFRGTINGNLISNCRIKVSITSESCSVRLHMICIPILQKTSARIVYIQPLFRLSSAENNDSMNHFNYIHAFYCI